MRTFDQKKTLIATIDRRDKSDTRIPSLDGIRAISILLVIVSHIVFVSFSADGEWARLVRYFSSLGHFGVQVFFVLSGYLITSLLLKEHATRGRISLRDFYLRRTFRIFPAAWFYLTCLAVLSAAGLVPVQRMELLAGYAYLTNYYDAMTWTTGHLWSLSVEEQFYLLWPGSLVLFGMRSGSRIATAVVLMVPCVRVVYLINPDLRDGLGRQFETVADTIAGGCLLAIWQSRAAAATGYNRMLQSAWFAPAAGAALFLLHTLNQSTRFQNFFGTTLVTLVLAVTVDRYVRFPGLDAFGRFLNRPAVAYLGYLSYSLYLWQQLFIRREALAFSPLAVPMALVLTFAAALFSYYFVEKPFLALRLWLVQGPSRRPST